MENLREMVIQTYLYSGVQSGLGKISELREYNSVLNK
jgi:hypothetical protein